MFWVTSLFIYLLTCYNDIHSFIHSDGTNSGHQVVSTVEYIIQIIDNADFWLRSMNCLDLYSECKKLQYILWYLQLHTWGFFFFYCIC